MNILLTILQLLPAIIKAVQAAEALLPLPGQGKAKLDFVLGVISDVDAEAGKLTPQISAVVARIVSLCNSAGVFKAAAPVAPTV